MKRLLVTLLAAWLLLACIPALADDPLYDAMPQDIRDYLHKAQLTNTFIVNDFVRPAGGDTAFVAIGDNGVHRLMCFERVEKRWVLRWNRKNAMPDPDAAFGLIDLSGMTYNGLALGTAFSIRETDATGWECVYELDGKVWRLRMICWHDTDGTILETYLAEDGVVKYTGWRKKGQQRIYGTLQSDLRYFSWQDFPFDPDVLRTVMSNPPRIPEGTLTAKRIQFTGGRKYPVYNGPGESYGQSGGGRAMVSTNDWIQVFGVENGYAMIQYDITRDHMRIGWIDASALPVTASVPALRFHPVSAWTTTAVTLTDDPLHSGSAIITLPRGAWVTRLAVMGDWAYVESSTGDLLRGFVPRSALTEDQVFRLESCPWDDGRAPLRGTLTFTGSGVQLEITGCDTTLLGGIPTGFAVYDTQTRELLLTLKGSQPPLRGQCTTRADSLLICPIGPDGMADMTRAVRVER